MSKLNFEYDNTTHKVFIYPKEWAVWEVIEHLLKDSTRWESNKEITK